MINKTKNRRKYNYEMVKIKAKFNRHHFLILKLNNMQKKYGEQSILFQGLFWLYLF